MPIPRLFPLVVAVCIALAPIPRALASEVPATTEAKALVTAADLLNIKQLETPALSPDGRRVIYVVRSIEPKPAVTAEASAKEGAREDWLYRTQLWLAATDGKTAPRQLTRGHANSSSPVWSPSGDRIAFVRADEKGKAQIHVLAVAGGEAQPVTKLETGAGNPRWSPDGKKILFTTSLSYSQVRAALEKKSKDAKPGWAYERPGRQANDTANWPAKDDRKPDANPDGTLQEIREWLAKNEADGSPRVLNRLNFLGESDLTIESNYLQFHTVSADAETEPEAITLGYEGYTAPEWLQDGRSLVCLGPRNTGVHTDRDRYSSLYLIDVATGAARVLLENPGDNYGAPLPSPDGKWLAFTTTGGGDFTFEQPVVTILPVAGGEPRRLTAQLDRPMTTLRWTPDSKFIYFVAADRGRFPLYRVSPDQGGPERLTAPNDWGIRDYAIGAQVLVQVVTQPGNPWEMYAGPADGKTTAPLTTHNAWTNERQLSAYEPHRLVQGDGITVDYWMMKPANFDPAKKYPLLVQIHGGPTAMWGPGEASMWHEFQFYAARGYAIVFCNPRGSGGYGRDFQRANFKDWGTGPASDVLAAATFAAKEPWIDAKRQVITGGSYGGYLTTWIVGHDHRFKAAVTQRGVYDLPTFYGEGNAWFLVPLYWGGYPWEEKVRAILNRDSPLTYVQNIKTPLLIQHGDVDFRTGVIQSQLLYKSLKQLGRDVEYVRYPRATHELSRSGEPRQRLDTLVRYEEFFRRYLGGN
jgi:dipeptidyl aminopeptidase/acylaminoacyl peptidase